MKKRGAAALLAAICLLAGCAASDPALPAETRPRQRLRPRHTKGTPFLLTVPKGQRELLELPHEELPVELIFHHWTETAADYETRDETVIAGVLQALRDVSVESEVTHRLYRYPGAYICDGARGYLQFSGLINAGSKGWMAGAMSFPKMKSFGNWRGGFGQQTQNIRI